MSRRLWLVPALLWSATAARAAASFGDSALPAADYVLEKLKQHPVVLLGEAHWIRHDAMFVADLVPRLAQRRIVLAMETLPAAEQAALDRIVSAPEWDEAAAMRLMRLAAWPYREYLDIVRAAWQANRAAAGSMRIVALGPDANWRENLLKAKGVTYDQFMADLVTAEVAAGRGVLGYCGIHHAFTRYEQPELDLAGRATAFVDRAGNLLRRRLGERVFLITLHRPLWCGQEPWSYCLPVSGEIDCVAAPLGRAVGFDLSSSEFGEKLVDRSFYYAHGYPDLRFGELSDGWIWTRPIETYELVGLIPLAEFAPDEAALREVIANNPFTNEKSVDRARLEAIWAEQEKSRADVMAFRKWTGLKDWRKSCRPRR